MSCYNFIKSELFVNSKSNASSSNSNKSEQNISDMDKFIEELSMSLAQLFYFLEDAKCYLKENSQFLYYNQDSTELFFNSNKSLIKSSKSIESNNFFNSDVISRILMNIDDNVSSFEKLLNKKYSNNVRKGHNEIPEHKSANNMSNNTNNIDKDDVEFPKNDLYIYRGLLQIKELLDSLTQEFTNIRIQINSKLL